MTVGIDDGLVSPLEVGDTTFLVTSTIDRCPSTMMGRELVMNAIEAATRDVSGKGQVKIYNKTPKQFSGASKLAIWNNGPGMSDTDLLHIGNIAASMKSLALDGNFGMGAKVASLAANNLGLRYRSCKDGVVHQIILGKHNGQYGFLNQPTPPDGRLEKVIDVTPLFEKAPEYPLDSDWTEVMLLGNAPDQDTVFNPYGDPKTNKQWLWDALYHRFYRIPENVEIQFMEGTHIRDQNRGFKPFAQRYDRYARHEIVDAGDGFRVIYIHDPRAEAKHIYNVSRSGALGSTPSHAALVFKNEMYDVRRGTSWSAMAPDFGVTFGSPHILIHVELPDDFPAVPEAYRRFIQLQNGDQHQLEVREFAKLANENMPRWMKDVIAGYGPPPSASASNIERELQNLLNKLSVEASGLRSQDEGEQNANEGIGRGEKTDRKPRNTDPNPDPNPTEKQKPARYMEDLSGTRRAAHAQTRETAPKIIYLEEDELIEERGLVNRAGFYLQSTNQLFINCKYQAVQDLTAHLANEYAGVVATLGDEVRIKAKQVAINVATFRIGKAVVHAKAKFNANAWTAQDVDNACTRECLSIVTDDWVDAAHGASVELRKMLGISARHARDARAA